MIVLSHPELPKVDKDYSPLIFTHNVNMFRLNLPFVYFIVWLCVLILLNNTFPKHVAEILGFTVQPGGDELFRERIR